MPIKNYSSGMSVYESLGKIQGQLAMHGATKIMVDYQDGKPSGIAFGIMTPDGARGFLLPANIDGVIEVFRKQKVKADREQAERTAWKNICDWICAQMAFIESGNVEMEEVFLPYLTNGRGQTMYSLYKTGGLPLLTGSVDKLQ